MLADTVAVKCPECGLQMDVPAALLGKKIRCKKCQSVVAVAAAKAAAKPAGPAKAKAAAKPAPVDTRVASAETRKKLAADDEDDGGKPYGVLTADEKARCPHCAHEVDPPDARICLHCGYDLVRRVRVQSRVTLEHTGEDYFWWHAPAVGALLGALLLIGLCFFYHLWLPSLLVGDADVKELARARINPFDQDAKYNEMLTILFYWPIEFWLFFVSGWFSVSWIRYFIRRAFVETTPPEKVTRGGDDD